MTSTRINFAITAFLLLVTSASALPALFNTYENCEVYFHYPKNWEAKASGCYSGNTRILLASDHESEIVVMTRPKNEEITLLDHAKERATAWKELFPDDTSESTFDEVHDSKGYRIVESYSFRMFDVLEPRVRVHYLIPNEHRAIYLKIETHKGKERVDQDALNLVMSSIQIRIPNQAVDTTPAKRSALGLRVSL